MPASNPTREIFGISGSQPRVGVTRGKQGPSNGHPSVGEIRGNDRRAAS